MTTRKIGITEPASQSEEPNMLPVLRIRYPNPNPRKNDTSTMPIRTDENSASTTLIAKIGACRKFDNRTPNNGSYLFRKSPLNHSSSLKPFVKATTRRKGVRNRNRLGLIPATDIATTADSR